MYRNIFVFFFPSKRYPILNSSTKYVFVCTLNKTLYYPQMVFKFWFFVVLRVGMFFREIQILVGISEIFRMDDDDDILASIDLCELDGITEVRDFSHLRTKNFRFPYKPYEIQRDLMMALYQCLAESKVGIFESPTGTGKSLSLLCAALTWLVDERNRISDEENATFKEE